MPLMEFNSFLPPFSYAVHQFVLRFYLQKFTLYKFANSIDFDQFSALNEICKLFVSDRSFLTKEEVYVEGKFP